jgi:hypothetical protein
MCKQSTTLLDAKKLWSVTLTEQWIPETPLASLLYAIMLLRHEQGEPLPDWSIKCLQLI